MVLAAIEHLAVAELGGSVIFAEEFTNFAKLAPVIVQLKAKASLLSAKQEALITTKMMGSDQAHGQLLVLALG